MRGAGGPVHIETRIPHKQERHHTLIQNLKVMGLWVLLLIKCSTFTLLPDVGHITHTCTQQHSLSSVSPSIHHALLSSGSSYFACIVVAGFSANGPTLLVPLLLLPAQTAKLPLSHRALMPLLEHEGSKGTRQHRG